MSFIFILFGLAIALTPARTLVKVDGRTGYWIYKKKLEDTGDEEQALRSAGLFYKIFGTIFFLIGLFLFLNET